MHTVETDRAPLPLGHYAQALVHDGLVYVSGQLPINPATGAVAGPSIEEQMEQVLANLAAILAAAESGLHLALKVTVYIADMSLWGRANAAYARVLDGHRPARSVVPTLAIRPDCLVEIDAIAAVEGAG